MTCVFAIVTKYVSCTRVIIVSEGWRVSFGVRWPTTKKVAHPSYSEGYVHDSLTLAQGQIV